VRNYQRVGWAGAEQFLLLDLLKSIGTAGELWFCRTGQGTGSGRQEPGLGRVVKLPCQLAQKGVIFDDTSNRVPW